MPVIERWRALLLMGFVRGEQRSRGARLPVSLDERIPEAHLVRVIDLWVEQVDVVRLGFAKAVPKGTGRPPYDPADLLKLYLYGDLNQIRSSRKLERESQRNIEVLWLLKRLSPDFKTIANFRKEVAIFRISDLLWIKSKVPRML